jgi:hypothetical protein
VLALVRIFYFNCMFVMLAEPIKKRIRFLSNFSYLLPLCHDNICESGLLYTEFKLKMLFLLIYFVSVLRYVSVSNINF